MKSKLILSLLFGIFFISFISASPIWKATPSLPFEWNKQVTGNESLLFTIDSLNLNGIKICAVDKDLKDIDYTYCDSYLENGTYDKIENGTCDKWKTKKISYYDKIRLKDKDGNILDEKGKDGDKDVDTCYTFTLNPLQYVWYKIGESSIILSAETGYNATFTNVTQDDSFAHLNVSDADMLLYMPFDYPIENATWTTGNFSGALEFDGVNDYVDAGSGLDLLNNDSLSFFAWVKSNSYSSQNIVGGTIRNTYNAYRGYGLYFTSTSNIRAVVNDANTHQTYANLNYGGSLLGDWHHVGVVIDREVQDMTIYIDGVAGTPVSIASLNSIGANTGEFQLGDQSGTAVFNAFNGSIDEVRIFSRAINDTEISSLFDNVVLNSTGLVSHWDLDDGKGFQADDSVGSNHGTLTNFNSMPIKTYDYTNNSNDGTPTGGAGYVSDGYIGGAYEFDGVNDYVQTISSTSLGLQSNFTLSAWINPMSVSGYHRILCAQSSQENDYCILLNNNKLAYQIKNTGHANVSSSSINVNQWAHVTVVYDDSSNNIKFYIDGTKDSNEYVEERTPLGGSTYVRFGVGSGSLVHYFNGSIDEVMIFNRSLSAFEVGKIYNSTFERFHPTGNMRFEGINLQGNNTINISLEGCQRYNSSLLRFSMNGGSDYTLDGNCAYEGYQVTGDTSNAYLDIGFVTGANRFYSPLIYGNITLSEYFIQHASNVLYIYPNVNNSVVHIKLGEHLIFT